MRRAHDFYKTNKALGVALFDILDRYGLQRFGRVLEPCAGDGGLASVISQHAASVHKNDLYIRFGQDSWLDAASNYFWHSIERPDWVITNPPYKGNILNRILEKSLCYCRVGTIMLLRLSFLEPTTKRNPRHPILDEWKGNLRFVIPISSPRPSFTHDGKTDSVTTAWFVFDKRWSWSLMDMHSPFQFIVDWNNGGV